MVFSTVLHLLVAGFCTVSGEIVLSSYMPRYGSANGATTISIIGEFNINPFSATGELENDNRVIFVGDFQEYEADVEKDSTHETQITAYTRPMPYGYYKVCPEVDGERECFTTKFQVAASWTPKITEFHFENTTDNFAGPPRSLVTVRGVFLTDVYGPNDFEIVGGNERTIRRVLAGPDECSLIVEGETDELYDLRYDPEDQTYYGILTCKMESDFVGNNNFSFLVSEAGRSLPNQDLMRVTGDDKIYMFQTYAEILGVSPNSGSIMGGQEITISGRYFGPYETVLPEITIAGHPCVLVNQSENEIRCITPAAPDTMTETYSGSRGVLVEKWPQGSHGNNLDVLREILDSNTTGYTSWLQDSAWYESDDEYTVVKMTGNFIVPVSDDYQFYIITDDPGAVYMNCDGNSSDLTRIIYRGGYSGHVWTRYGDQRSEWMYLEKGQICYFQGISLNYYGPAALKIAALRATTTLTNAQSDNVIDERQFLRWSASAKNDHQHISLINWSPSTAVAEQQIVTVSSSCFQTSSCSVASYQLGYKGRASGTLFPNSQPFELQYALNEILPEYTSVSVTSQIVIGNDGNQTGIEYHVTFDGNLGDEAEITVEESSGVAVTIAESIKGLPSFEYFALEIFGKTTDAIPVDATSSDVEDAIMDIKGAKCPPDLLGSSGTINYLEVLDFEGSRPSGYSESGHRDSTLEAFCGNTALKNPYYIFYTGWSHFDAYRLEDYPTFCFAHRGVFADNISVLTRYKDLNSITRHRWFSIDLPFDTTSSEWSYHCVDLQNAIATAEPAYSDVMILRIEAFRRQSNLADFYLDAVIIASAEPDTNELMKRRQPPLMWQGEVMESIEVHKDNESLPEFELEISPYNCAHDLPLVKVVNTPVLIESDTDLTSATASNWPAHTMVNVTRTERTNIPMAGTFDLSYQDDDIGPITLSDIPADITEEDLESLLETVEGFGVIDVHGSGDRCYRRRLYVTWMSNGGNKRPLEVNVSNVFGEEDLDFDLDMLREGGVMHGPLPGQMTTLAFDTPQVEVFINGIRSSCSGDCSYDYSEANTPTVTSLSPSSGDAGTQTLMISGTMFDGPSYPRVYIGDVECTVTQATSTFLSCDCGALEYGEHDAYVYVDGKGLARHDGGPVTFQQDMVVESVTPRTGYTAGGLRMSINGRGLGDFITVTIGANHCLVVNSTSEWIECIVPKSATPGASLISLTADSSVTNAGNFDYSDVGAVVIQSVLPEQVYGAGGGNLTITVSSGDGNSIDRVFLGEEECDVLSMTSSEIVVVLPFLPSGSYELTLLDEEKGNADTYTFSIPMIQYTFMVSGIHPTQVSLFGGALMTLSGEGLTDSDEVTFVGSTEIPCEVETAFGNGLTCVIGSSAVNHIIENTGIHPDYGFGYAWNPSVVHITQGDTVVWRWELVVQNSLGIMVYEVDEPASTEYNGGFTSTSRMFNGIFKHTFNSVGSYYFATGNIDNEAFGSLNLFGTIHVHPFSNVPVGLRVINNDVEADIDILSPAEPLLVARSISCTPLNSGIPGCGDRKRREAGPTRQKRNVAIPVDDQDKAEFVRLHNEARAEVVPPATNMMMVRWDDQLATSAENHVLLCTDQHSSVRTHPDFSYVGENLASFSSNWPRNTLVRDAVNAWVNEIHDYNYTAGICSSSVVCGECTNVCGHYTQVVWHNSYAIGCGIADCGGDIQLACQYGEGGNYQGQYPYQQGTPCSNCPADFTDCDDNICAEAGGVTSPSTPEPYVTTDAVDAYETTSPSETTATPESTTPPETTPSGETTVIELSTCFTPIVTSISPQFGTVNDTIQIEGTGFGDDSCRVTVSMEGEIDCVVTFANETLIQCEPSPNADSRILTSLEVEVEILGYGYAFIDIEEDSLRRFALVPSWESIHPSSGSIEGGNTVSINGTGFVTGDVVVVFGGAECVVTHHSYFYIECVTSKGTEGVQTVSVFVGENLAECDACEYEYADDMTPDVTMIDPVVITAENTQVYFTGSKFLPSAHISAGGYECQVDSESDTSVNCTFPSLPAGDHEIVFHVHGKGYARLSTLTITGLLTVDGLNPSVGSTAGGLSVDVTGYGFNTEDLSVTVDSMEAEIVDGSVSNTQFTFITPPGAAGTQTVVVSSSNGQFAVSSFEYSSDITPTVTALSISEGFVGDAITLTGTHLNGTAVVFFGDAECQIVSQNATSITCDVTEPSSGGTYAPMVSIVGVGYAETNGLSFTYIIEIMSFTPTEGSVGGGNTLTVSGSGFHVDSNVYVGRGVCHVTQANYNSIDCEIEETPSLSMREDPVTSHEVDIGGDGVTVFQSDPYDFHWTLGQAAEHCTDCDDQWTGLPTASGDEALRSPDGYLTESMGSVSIYTPQFISPSYVCLGNLLLDQDPPENFACVHHMLVEETTPTLFANVGSLYMWEASGTPFTMFTTTVDPPTMYKLKDLSQPIADISVPVEVKLFNDDWEELYSVTSPSNYTFTVALTPVVSSVSPARGGTGGGTLVTIGGSDFSDTMSENTVSINGVDCVVQTASNTEITCITGPSNGSVKASVTVNVLGAGQSLGVESQFFYVDVWSSPYTWGGLGVPGEGAFVVIPVGQDIMIDQDVDTLEMLLIEGGRVFFDQKDIEFNANYILIMDGGRLEVGTEDEPFQHKAIITLHGHVRSTEIPIYGTKGIGVREGTLDLHGQYVPVTWTKLAQTVEAGESVIVVKHPVTWQAGDKIVIASTGDKFSQNENEEVTIASVAADEVTITLTDPVEYRHWGIEESLSDGTVLPAQAEVGLLTRNVVVRGSRHADWDEQIDACPDGFNPGEFAQQTCFLGRHGTERGSDQFGAQIMFHHPSQSLQQAFGRLSYVEFYHMGQAFRLGRYPIHFHLMGDMQYRNYIRGCSIHESFNRAVTIHDTHKALVEKNVIYNAMGGAMFIEDGIETGNILRENLVVFCRQSTSLQNEDITPAAFWVTNPDNIVEHNAAAGGTHFGYWYRMHENPSGPSFTSSICPRKIELTSFYNNTAHSLGWFGLWIFPEYTPKAGSCCNCEGNSIAEIRNFTVWNADKGVEFVNTGAVQVRDSLFFNNRFAGVEVKMMIDPLWGEAGIYDSVIAGHSSISTPNDKKGSAIVLPYTDGWEVSGVTFINFNDPGEAVLSTTTIVGTCADYCGGFHSKFSSIGHVAVTNLGKFRWEHENFIEDMDGSLTGAGMARVVIPSTDTAPSSCVEKAEWSVGGYPGMECPDMRLHRVAWNNALPTSLDGSSANLTNQHGTTEVFFTKKGMTHPLGWRALLFDGMKYEWLFDHLPLLSNITYSAMFSNYRSSECNIISHTFTSTPDRFTIVAGQDKNSTDAPLSCSDNEHGDYYFDETTKTLEYIVKGESLLLRKKRATQSPDPSAINRDVSINMYRCFFEDCIPPPDPNTVPPAVERPRDFDRWSDATYWPTGTVPAAGEDVTIPSGDWVVVDVPTLEIDTFLVYGVAEFENTVQNTEIPNNFTVKARIIFIRGGRLILGWEDDLFLGLAEIILTGDISDDEYDLTQDVTLGTKAIGAFGGLDLHGADVATAWTHLLYTAIPGENTIMLAELVDWVEGNEIMITPTAFDPWEAEIFKIESVNAGTNTTMLVLNGTLQYKHLASDYTFGNVDYRIAAEVGLLTRNIKIRGEWNGDSSGQSFGGRVIVGTILLQNAQFIGYARVQNVEFVGMGQEGYSDRTDPRYAFVYSETGTQNRIRPSYLKKCSFAHNYNTAVGAFGANSITMSDNVIYHTVGPSIRVQGEDNRVLDNLVSLMINPGTYNGKTNYIWDWFGAIQVFAASSVTLQGNVVAGSERSAYWLGGEPCDEEWFSGNTARSSVYGVYVNKFGQGLCSAIRDFNIHYSYYFGIYFQDSSNIEISDCLITDSGVGILTLFNGPSSAAHLYQEKQGSITNVQIVAVTEPGVCPQLDTSAGYILASSNAQTPNDVRSSTVGIMAPSFMSAHNAAPKKPFPGLMQYPALGGKLTIQGASFVNFGDATCSGVDHTAITMNSKNEDYHHPLFVSQSTFVNSPTGTRVYYSRPSLGKINPSDCVDMECDGHKNFIITDLDGTFLGTPGDIIPEAEFEWDGDTARGLGDYNIPETLLTYPNGTRIPIDEIAPNKGIMRADDAARNCVYQSAWQAYECHGYDHQLFLLESLDIDSETRRIAPVALLTDGYVDLENGPQDHGWCAGYTCQLRLSTFFTTTAIGSVYEIHFSGTNPTQLRLRLPHASADDAIVACIFYSTSNRLDVYYNDAYVMPTNGYEQNGQVLTDAPPEDQPMLYMPNVTSPAASNFYSRYTKTLCITVRGPLPIDAVVSKAIFLSFNVPSVTEDEFFDNARKNLAILLGVTEDRIWIANAVSELSGRRRKREGELTVTFGIGSQPATASPVVERTIPRAVVEESDNGTVTIVSPGEPDEATELAAAADEAERAALLANMETIAAVVESGQATELITDGVPISGIALTPPPPTPTTDTENGTDSVEPIVLVEVASLATVASPDPMGGRAGVAFQGAAVYQLLDVNGDVASPLAHWVVKASIFEGDDETASIVSGSEEPMVDGIARFEDLTIDKGGRYVLQFVAESGNISSGNTNFIVTAPAINLRPPRVPTECTDEEGDDFFDKEYIWEQDNCTHLCTYNCDGSGERCSDMTSCGPHAECLDHECVCGITTFDPNLPENLEATLSPEIECASSYIELTIDKCGANAIGFNLAKLFLRGEGLRLRRAAVETVFPADRSCSGRVINTFDGIRYSFKLEGNLNECDPEVIDNGTHIQYYHIMHGYKPVRHGNIIRDRPIEVEFMCAYPSMSKETLDTPILPYISVITIGVESQGSYNVTMSLWTDSDYTVPLQSPASILVPDPLHVSVKAVGADSVVVSIDKCSAYSSQDTDSALSVDLITDGCPNTLIDVEVTQIGTSNEARFRFPSFVLSTESTEGGLDGELYLECFVVMCTEDLEPCTPDCGGLRKRRGLPGNTITLGPIPVGAVDQSQGQHTRKREVGEGVGYVKAKWGF